MQKILVIHSFNIHLPTHVGFYLRICAPTNKQKCINSYFNVLTFIHRPMHLGVELMYV